jgi:hypothetical protein
LTPFTLTSSIRFGQETEGETMSGAKLRLRCQFADMCSDELAKNWKKKSGLSATISMLADRRSKQ